jgi:very-short-patch-repair endonuclease
MRLSMNARPLAAATDREKTARSRALRRDSTEAETCLWSILRNRSLDGWKFRRQVSIDSFIIDFGCIEGRLIVEVDGEQHADKQKRYDEARTRELQAHGFRILRLWNSKVLMETEGVIQEISRMLNAGNQSAK